jgi:DNA-binding transcriptional regulator YdaS (Cro superfamily)
MKRQTLPDLLHIRGLKLVDLARRLKVDKATVTRWSQKEVPADRVADVVRATGIPAEQIRPDMAKIFAGGAQ